MRFALASRRVVTPDAVRAAALIIDGEKIEAIVPREDVPATLPLEDLDNLVISPGAVDAHVHINEPGRTDWEGFETATRAAAAGGVTTLVDMPLNSSPVTTTVAALEAKRAAAMDGEPRGSSPRSGEPRGSSPRSKCWVDVGFHAGLVPGNLAHIEPLITAGVCGVKAFLCDSGLADFPASAEADLDAALPLLARHNVPLLVHAEIVAAQDPPDEPKEIRSYRDWLDSRPGDFERSAAAVLRKLCEAHRAPIHVVHLANGTLTTHFYWAKHDGLPLTVETCPHYLHFYAEALDKADPRFKCAPPIRTKEHRDRLWEALIYGVIDTIGSDHSPCPPEMKHLDSNDWQHAWGGIASLELTLPIVWRGLRSHMVPFNRVADWLARNPARLIGLAHRKGALLPGLDADLCIWDPEQEWNVDAALLHQRHKLTPYDGQRLRGQVIRTYVRGKLVYNEGAFAAEPIGQLLQRGKV